MKEKLISIKVSYPVPMTILVLNADEIKNEDYDYVLYKNDLNVGVLNKSKFSSELKKTSENMFLEFYEIYIN